jgi:aminoglycoside phosphotransferase (APT) family kinase protein
MSTIGQAEGGADAHNESRAEEHGEGQFSGTKPIEAIHQFDQDALYGYLEAHLEGFAGPMRVAQFKGGQSCPTYRIEARSGTYVLRRKPPGKLLPSAHAVDREYRVITALYAAGFPVPRTYLLCTDENVVGTMFYVMDCVDGRVFWDPTMPELSSAQRGAAYDSMNETMAKLHSFDVAKLGLADFGRPGNYFARQIGRWSKQYKASETTAIHAMDRLMEWLPENNPADDTNVLVHGDFALHNMLFHPYEPRVVAILDWEISTLGHPLGDLSYNCLQWYAPPFDGGMATFGDTDTEALGIPSLSRYIDAYEARSGYQLAGNLGFYKAYNLFRLACIYQGIIGRVRDGTAANPHAAELEQRISPLAEAAWREVQRLS